MRKILSSTFVSMLLFASSSLHAQEAGTVDIGLGLGIPYGLFGGNVEVFVIDNLSLHASLGHTIIADVGYGAGVQYYFGDEGNWSPNISIHYGTYGVIGNDFKTYTYRQDDFEDEQFEGLIIGGGVRKIWGNHGLSISGHYILDSDLWDRQDELEEQDIVFDDYGKVGDSRFKLSIGYVLSF